MLYDFVAALRQHRPPALTTATARRDLWMVEQAYLDAGVPRP